MISDLHASDIMFEELFFFDPEDKAFCRQFCRKRNIDFLPVEGEEKLMELNGSVFEERSLEPNLRFDPNSTLLNNELVGPFNQKPTRFAFKDGEFKGVLHFSDYNNSVVYKEAYETLYFVEQKLRYILENNHLEKEVKDRFEDDEHFAPLSKSKLRDVLEKSFKFSDEFEVSFFHQEDQEVISDIVDFRNRVMHAKEFVSLTEESKINMHYDRESFFKFVDTTRKLEKLYSELDHKIDCYPRDTVAFTRLT